MKKKYKVEFFHDPFYSAEEDNSNREIVERVINEFGDESRKIKQESLLIYFGAKSQFSLGKLGPKTLGILLVKGSSEYQEFTNNKKNQRELSLITDFRTFEYFIYLSNYIRTVDDDIDKVLTIAHELQHVLQFGKLSGNFHKKHTVLFKYYLLKKMNTNDLPKEIDAIRASKKICHKIFNKTRFDSFIDHKIHMYTNIPEEKQYWEIIGAADLNKPYKLQKEIEQSWDQQKQSISSEIIKIKQKKDIKIDEEKEFLRAYNKLI